MKLLPVHVDGAHLKTSDGKPFKAIGVADFAQFKRYLVSDADGWSVLVKPILDERRNLALKAGYDGPLVARVFRYAAPMWNAFGIHPWSYPMAKVTEFTQRLGAEGWYVDWTCGDSQVVLSREDGDHGQQEHLNQFCAALVGCDNAFIVQTCNEPFKNGIDVSKVKPAKWGTYLTNSGMYYGDNWDRSTDLDVINFHPERGDDNDHTVPKFVGKLFESAVYLEPLGKPIIYDEPIGADEVNQPGRRCNNPRYWGEMGLALGLVDGVYFHSTPGLSSDGFGPVVKDCFVEFVRGAKAGMSV